MSLRRAALACGSIALSILLIDLLVRISGVNWTDVATHFRGLDWAAFFRLAALMALNTYISSRKWQLVDKVMRRATDRRVSEGRSFALTSMGVALGQVLPVQVASSVARTLGTWVYGSPVRRGTISTLVEQGSDLLIVVLLAIASAGTILLRGGGGAWFGLALAVWTLAMLSVPLLLRLIRKLSWSVAGKGRLTAVWRKRVAELCDSGLLNARLGRQLMALSTARFAILVLMAGQTSAAIHCSLPLWHLTAAMPVVVLANAIGITPGGLGFTEFSYSVMLKVYGTPLATATQWALANRLLTSAAAFVVTLVAVPLLLGIKAIPISRSEMTGPACE